jgi:hypothetical protein
VHLHRSGWLLVRRRIDGVDSHVVKKAVCCNVFGRRSVFAHRSVPDVCLTTEGWSSFTP